MTREQRQSIFDILRPHMAQGDCTQVLDEIASIMAPTPEPMREHGFYRNEKGVLCFAD
jgi:hypothetical protein